MLLYICTFFIIGTCIGSFLNVVADRVINKGSILGRSKCDFCKKELSPIDLIPVVGFFLIAGKCRYCKRKLSFQYPVVEALCGILFGLVAYIFISGPLIVTAFYLFLISVLIVVSIVDFKFSLIPTAFLFFASLVGLFLNFFILDSAGFVNHVYAAFGAALFFLFIVVITRGRGMGEGDIPLAFLIGLVLGVKDGAIALFLAFLSGAFISVFLITLGRKRFGQTVPFAPFLVFGFLLSLFFAQELFRYYLMLY